MNGNKKYGKHIQLNMTNLGPFYQYHRLMPSFISQTKKKNKSWLSLPNTFFY